MGQVMKGFFAYSSEPDEVGQSIEQASKLVCGKNIGLELSTWKALNVVGNFIADSVIQGIRDSDFFLADVTRLNFNVTYEVGYAIGMGKKIVLTRNKSIKESAPTIKEVGIFDTLGYSEYQNSNELASLIEKVSKTDPIPISNNIDIKAPIYLLDSKYKTDWATRIVSRIKKTGYIFRNFDPSEQPRLSASDAIANVSKSYGVVVPLISATYAESDIHNLRGAFIAGLADGMGKALLILQWGEEPVPLDYRDFVNVCFHPDDVNENVAKLAAKVAEAYQSVSDVKEEGKKSFLQSLDIGASSAENEMRSLEEYYLKTDQFQKSLRGEAHLVVGRKGSGKSAIFLQVRDRERNVNGNIVLDLKPDGYKLIKFKELILGYLQEGTFQHTIMAFWEYVLLLEICYKILEKDRERHIRDHEIYELYRELSDLYHAEGYSTEGDFSERMSSLMERISSEYRSRYGDAKGVRLSAPEVTEILYCHDVRELLEKILEYMRQKNTLWLLFDNIDKGWPASGLMHEDLVIVRALIDATRKIERQLSRNNGDVNTIVFLRNDVYELLVAETSDKGKEASVLLDWTDVDLLRELIRLRIVSNGLPKDAPFMHAWGRVCVSHYKGEETSLFLIERSLMRPRFLLNLINQCKSFAVNLNHDVIQEDDIEKGLAAYSTDLLTDIGYELVDVAPDSEGVLYAFIGSVPEMSMLNVKQLISDFLGSEDGVADKIFRLLLWYGFLGVRLHDDDVKYIYHFNYNMMLFEGVLKKKGDDMLLVVNPAFRMALLID
jgi:hypothetical protein